MRKLVPGALIALVLLALAAPAWAQTSSGVQIREVNLESFPVVTVTVALQGAASGTIPSIQVKENGKALTAPPAVHPFGTGGQRIQVVLAIDTSGSMQGSPLAAAVAAAKSFLKGAAAFNSVSVGLVTFSSSPTVVQPITHKLSTVQHELNALQATGETALFDAVVEAAQLFRAGGDDQHNIIVLSDGGDTVSKGTLRSVINASKVANASIFSIGLKTPETDVKSLKTMSARSKGSYASADQADLEATYQRILSTLTQQVQVTYKSKAARGSAFTITITSPQGTDTVTARAPEAAATAGPPPSPVPHPKTNQTSLERLLSGNWALGGILAVCFIAAFIVIAMFLTPVARARRERDLAGRMGMGPQREERPEKNLASFLPTLAAAGDRLAEASGTTLALERKLEQAGLSLTPGEIVTGSIILTFVGAVFGGLLIGGWLFALIFAALFGLLPLGYLWYSIRKRTTALLAQLPDILMILASSLRAGHSFMQAIDTVSKEAGDPGGKEFARVVAEIRLGRPVDEALNAMADRVGSDDFKWAMLAVNIQREVGGNLAEVLDTVSETLREREVVRRQIDTLSVEGKMSMYILIALPVLIGLYIYRVNNDYIKILFDSTIGLIMFIGALVGLVVGFLWMRKVVKIDV